ncbi:hypothetical protein [Streptomyces sp. B21-108]|jgi:hypothetical protein|uniref:hypothetical protein n=1 Tax=Streptomyces sp. B21-108 TaxID=3039419 RepID=UPI002FEF2AAE
MTEDAQKKEREWAATKASAKGFLICLTVLSLVGAVAWFALTTGLERLPSKVCDGAVERDVVVRVLPRTRTAEERASQRHEGERLMFSCNIYTSADPILSGMARVEDVSPGKWLDFYGGAGERKVIRASFNGIEALAELDDDSGSSHIYVPCVPEGIQTQKSNEPYAITVEAGVIGEGRVSGATLRQAVTDFGYQLAKHSYKLAGCQNPRNFPEELPRYDNE